MARLKELYDNELRSKLQEQLGLENIMAVPRISKITLNMGVGEAVGDKKIMDNALRDLEQIRGQKLVVTVARKTIDGFKMRDGWTVGCNVTHIGRRI